MKKLILTAIALTALITVRAAGETVLNMTFRDGTTSTYVLSKRPSIVISNDSITIRTADSVVKYLAYHVLRYNYMNVNAINGIRVADTMKRNGDVIILNDVIDVSDVTVYSLDGKTVSVEKSITDQGVVISLSHLCKGIYVLKSNGKTVKILKP